MAALDVTDFQRAVRDWGQDVFDEALDEMLDALDEVVPVGSERDRRAPHMRDQRRVFRLGPARAAIEYPVEHATYTDEGTVPHRIEGNPLLAFYWEQAGTFVIVRSVRHPGTRGTRWWSNTMTDERWHRALVVAADRVQLR